jgi:sugar lactone lactonase YvrE
MRQVAGLEVFDDRACSLGEGPHYDERADRVVWVDILRSRVLWRHLDGRQGEREVPGHVGAAVPRAGGGLVLCLPAGPVLAGPDWSLQPLGSYDEADRAAGAAPPPEGTIRSNDAKADPAGRLWLGTMTYEEIPGAGALYRLDPGAGRPLRVAGGVSVSNGLGWSPDARTMYYIDSPTREVVACDYDVASGELGPWRPFATIEAGFPDGMCVDAEGGVWVALWQASAVRRYDPKGRLDRVLELPTPQVSSCAFAGDGLDILVVTTARTGRPDEDTAAGLTYATASTGVVGRAADRFAG